MKFHKAILYGSRVMTTFTKSRSTFGECAVCRQFVEKVKSAKIAITLDSLMKLHRDTLILCVTSL